MDLSSLRDRLIEAAAIAALLGGGAQVVRNAINDGAQDVRIERTETVQAELTEQLDEIQKDVRTARDGIIRMETKMEASE